METLFKDTHYEYELLYFVLEHATEQTHSGLIRDESCITDSISANDELDKDGIPTGTTDVAFRARQQIIIRFWHELRQKYPNPETACVHNISLDEDIFLRAVSLDEARDHSARQYLSTKAFLRIEDVLVHARPVGRVDTKPDTANQRDFEKLLIMTYEYEDIGRIKLTVGLKRRKRKEDNPQKIEYAITHLQEGRPLLPPKAKEKKKAPHKK